MNWYFAAGDAPFFYPENIAAFSWLPQVIDWSKGFGESTISKLWLEYPFRLLVKILFTLGLSWFLIEKIIWFGAVAIGIYGSLKLGTYILGRTKFRFFVPLIYLTNTYILMIFGGGQVGVFIGYCLFPCVLYAFFRYVETFTVPKLQIPNYKFQRIIQLGILNSLLFACDLRVGILMIGCGIGYLLFSIFLNRNKVKIIPVVWAIVLIGLIILISHLYWILPAVFVKTAIPILGSEYTGSGMAEFLSFADFSHALSLLHPNWPENLFGKTYFLQPEFLLLPLLAFSSLLFLNKDRISLIKDRILLFLICIALLGAFLAKGANPPFGNIFLWMFDHVPGLVLFRDPTKFYVLLALSYSVLIPYTLSELSYRWKCIDMLLAKYVMTTLFIVVWCLSVRDLLTGQLTGNFKPQYVPPDYVRLKTLLKDDQQFSRTLWIPTGEQYAYRSDTHPMLSGYQIYTESSVPGMMAQMETSRLLMLLQVIYCLPAVQIRHWNCKM